MMVMLSYLDLMFEQKIILNNTKKIPKKPTKPDESECCNRGCENCVFIYYERALKNWRRKIQHLKSKGLI